MQINISETLNLVKNINLFQKIKNVTMKDAKLIHFGEIAKGAPWLTV